MNIRSEGVGSSAAAPLLVPLAPRSRLKGPPLGATTELPQQLGEVTGGGLVGLLDPDSGLVGLWRGQTRLTGDLTIALGGSRASPQAPFQARDGGWMGRYRLADGAELIETGLLADSVGACVLQWALRPAASDVASPLGVAPTGDLVVRVLDASGRIRSSARLSISPDETASLAVLPPDGDPARAAGLLGALAAREKQRQARSARESLEPFGISVDGSTPADIEAALRRLDDAAVDAPGGRRPPLFVGGVSPQGPSYLAGSGLAELGVAALLTGRWKSTTAVLQLLADDREVPPLPFLYLAAQHVLWTGASDVVSSLRAAVEHAAERLLDPNTPLSSATEAFPDRREVFALLKAALEPFGRLAPRLPDSRISTDGRSGSRAELPMAGSLPPTPSAAPRAGARTPARPVPRDSARPAAATIRSARLLRAWVQDEIGVEPDASFGRVRLAPRVGGDWERLDVRGLAVADAVLRLEILSSPATYELHVSQEGGRIPLNLILAPILPLRSVAEVRLGGEAIEADITPLPSGQRVQLQFPLDSPRTIVVTGTP